MNWVTNSATIAPHGPATARPMRIPLAAMSSELNRCNQSTRGFSNMSAENTMRRDHPTKAWAGHNVRIPLGRHSRSENEKARPYRNRQVARASGETSAPRALRSLRSVSPRMIHDGGGEDEL